MSLPAGYTVRPMRQEDAALIAERSGVYTSALLGFAKHSPEDVANYLRDPGIDLATDAWVVLGPDGEFAGSATAVLITGGSHVGLDIFNEDPAVLDWLLDRSERRARELDRDEVILKLGVIRQDEQLPKTLAAHGFAIGTSTHRMRITFDGPVPPPGWASTRPRAAAGWPSSCSGTRLRSTPPPAAPAQSCTSTRATRPRRSRSTPAPACAQT